jgi:hypothetical protein
MILKIQRSAKNRMKSSVGKFADGDVSAVRFFATYYTNFLAGLALTALPERAGR